MYEPVLLCHLFAWVVPSIVCCAQTYGKPDLLRDVKICPESTCLAESRPDVLSFIARFRAGFAPTSVLAEDGSVRRWSLHWGVGVAIWSREGRSRYVASSSLTRCMPDLGIPKTVVLATRNSKAWLMIAWRLRKSLPVASLPSSLAANSALTRPRSSLVPSDGTALLQLSRRSANKPSIGMCDSCEPSAWRIVVGTSCTTPLSPVLVAVSRALASCSKRLSWRSPD